MNDVTFATYESLQAKDERIIKRLITAFVVCVVLLFASNALWIIVWARSNESASSVKVESTEGNANYIGHDGDITNGKD